MHEEVHERAGQQRQKNQRAQDVGTVLGEQKRTADDEKPDEDKPGARRDEARARLRPLAGMVVVVNGHEVSSSTMRRPRNIPIGHENANSAGSLGSVPMQATQPEHIV
jgi:hypothetical protein